MVGFLFQIEYKFKQVDCISFIKILIDNSNIPYQTYYNDMSQSWDKPTTDLNKEAGQSAFQFIDAHNAPTISPRGQKTQFHIFLSKVTQKHRHLRREEVVQQLVPTLLRAWNPQEKIMVKI